MTFSQILAQAQDKDAAAIELVFNMYHPLLIRRSIVKGSIDNDLFQENGAILLRCIQTFKIELDVKDEK